MLARTVALCALVALAAGPLGRPAAEAADPVTVKAPLIAAGFSTFMVRYITTKGIDKKHGVVIDDTGGMYSNVATFYQDFFQGRYDLANGTADNFAARHMAGAPIQMIATLTRANVTSLVVRADGGVKEIKDLRGKTIAIPGGTGTARMAELFFKKFYDLELNKDVSVVNVPSHALGLTYVEAGRADAALAWEPAVSISMHRSKNMKVLTNLEEIFREKTGHPLYFYVLAMRTDKLKAHPDVAAKVVAVFQEAARDIKANPDDALTIAAKTIEVDKAAMMDGIKNGRVSFDVRPANDPTVVKAIRTILDFMTDNGVFKEKVAANFLHGM